MKRNIQKMTQEQYDVLVIGGGINGAGIAHTASLNGLKTALVEKGDFASGTSSKSTKLMHGGLRYLENFEFDLVRESLKERTVQLKSAPHLVHSLNFLVPVYKTDRRPFWMMKFGVWLYDFLSRSHVIEKHRVLSEEGVCHLIPSIQREGLLGGVIYSDAQMNDARLCLENALSAAQHGADIANYCEVRSLVQENGKAVGAKVRDLISNENFEIRAKKIICAVGPWTNEFMKKENSQSPPQVRTTKGIHIVCKGRISNHAILVPAIADRRVFFIIPWMDNSLIGTTDTDFKGSPDDVKVKQEDIDYLIREVHRVLPHSDLIEENIMTTFAGLRPLVRGTGSPEKMSRKHVIKTSYSGVVYVFGGKYTTYRKIAEEAVSQITKKSLKDTQEYFPVYGSGKINEDPGILDQKYNMPTETIQSLMDFYGVRYKDILELIDEDPSLKEPICTCSPVIRAQITYAIKAEMAQTKEDIIMRRLTLGFNDCESGACRKAIEQMFAAVKA